MTVHAFWDAETRTVPCCGAKTADLPLEDSMAITLQTLVTCPPDGMGARASAILHDLVELAPLALTLGEHLDPTIGNGHYGIQEQAAVVRLLDAVFKLGYDADAVLQGLVLPQG